MVTEQKLTFGVILPHTKIFGGVKRFFEIGNILIGKGHRFTVFTPEGAAPDWFDFAGDVIALEKMHTYSLHALFITEPDYLGLLKQSRTRLRIFYAILQRRSYVNKILDQNDLIILANSTTLYQYLEGKLDRNLYKAVGGIDTERFRFKPLVQGTRGIHPLIVMAYGRFYKRRKGTMLVVKACEKLYKSGYNIKLHLFDSATDQKSLDKLKRFKCRVPHEFFIGYPVMDLPDIYYKADIFVSAERNAGWSNTCAEAMACGVPVIATCSGTQDFLIHGQTGLLVWRHPWFIRRAIVKLYEDAAMRRQLAQHARKKIEEFSWEHLANHLLSIVEMNLRR